MNLGLFSLMPQRDAARTPQAIYGDMTDQVAIADDAGFDVAWFAEHHFSNYCLCPSPLAMAMYAAGRTQRIRLGAAVLVLPLYEPLRMLEDFAVLDQISGGRAILGIGSGYQKHEFHRFGVEIEEGYDRFHEYVEVIERYLAGDPLSYEGKFLQIPEVYFSVRPLQKKPDVLVAGLLGDPKIQQKIARNGWIPIVTTGWAPVSALEETRAKVEQHHSDAGVDPEAARVAFQKYVHITDDRARALEAADHARYVRRIAMAMREQYAEIDGAFLKEQEAKGEPPLDEIADGLWVGPPDVVAERMVADLKTVRPVHVSCFMAFGGLAGRQVTDSMERFITEVVPLVEREIGEPLLHPAMTAAAAER